MHSMIDEAEGDAERAGLLRESTGQPEAASRVNSPRRKEWRVLLCLTLLALLLRLIFILNFEQVITPDGTQYVTLGRGLVAGDFRAGLSVYWPPLYPLLVGLSTLIFRDADFAGRLVSALAGSLVVIPAYKLTRLWYGARPALICACLVALHPVLLYYSTQILTESTYTLLFTSGILAGWLALSGDGSNSGGNSGSRRRRARTFLIAGALFGACYLLKPEAFGFLPLLLAIILGRKLFDRTRSFKLSLRDALLLGAGFLLLAAPYLFYLRHETGAWTVSGKLAEHMWRGDQVAGNGLTPAPLPLAPGFKIIIVQVTKSLRAEYEVFNLIFPPVFVLLVGLCLFRRRWTGARARRELYLIAFIAATLAGYAVTLSNIRFVVPLLPLLLCWVSQGIIEFAEWANETALKMKSAGRAWWSSIGKLVVPVVVAGLLAVLLPLSIYLFRGDKWDDYRGLKHAALWIKAHEPAPLPIMATGPLPSYYAGGHHTRLVNEGYAEFIKRARLKGAGFIVVNERDVKNMNRSLRELLDEESAHPGLRLVYRSAETPGNKIFVYVLAEDAPQDAPQ